ncbi:MAG: hypothetical protein JXR30_02960 [Alphaproteobacteria bacterium]|nr:hypothetical protein [Alphaproteobacteria bacterium]
MKALLKLVLVVVVIVAAYMLLTNKKSEEATTAPETAVEATTEAPAVDATADEVKPEEAAE